MTAEFGRPEEATLKNMTTSGTDITSTNRPSPIVVQKTFLL